jgi:TPR repeat protein
LGKCYLHGYGVEQDLSEAYNYLSSAEQGLIGQIEDGDSFAAAKIVLHNVMKEMDIARSMLYSLE